MKGSTPLVSLKLLKVLALLVLAPAALAAQGPGSRELTLDEAVARALSSSSRLGATAAEAEAAEARVAQARTGRFPSLTLEGSYMRLKEQDPATIELPPPPQGPGPVTLGESIENAFAATLSVQQPLFTGGEIDARVDAARRAVSATQASHGWQEGGVELQVRQAYWGLLEAELRVEALAERVRQVEANLANMERRRENGVVTRNEVLVVEMKLAEARLQLLRGENARELASTRLALLVDLPPEVELIPVTALPNRPTAGGGAAEREVSLGELLEQALSRREDLAAERSQVEAALAAESGARSGWYPKFFLAGEYTYARPNQAFFPPENEFNGSWRVGVLGRIDLGALPRVYQETRERSARVAAALARLDAAEQRVRLSVREAYLTWQSRGEEISLAETMVRQAEENLADTRARVANGVALNEELLEAQATLLQARLSLTSARTSRQVAWERLLRETGQEL